MTYVYRRPADIRPPRCLSPALFALGAPESVLVGAAAVLSGGQALKANQAVLLLFAAVSAAGQALNVIGSEIVQIAAAAVSVSGRAVSVAGRWALNVKRLFVSLNDING